MILEGTAQYAGHFLAHAEGFGLQLLTSYAAFSFRPFFVFSSNLSNFEEKGKKSHHKIQNLIFFL